MTSITVYSQPACPQCDATKRLMTAKRIEFNAIDLAEDAEAMAKVKAMGYRSAPVVVAGDDHWSGFRPDKINALS
tara:strand:- start:1066 stop:1290 length:225 start_codon:yes stop_codon:yes gene_type:complete